MNNKHRGIIAAVVLLCFTAVVVIASGLLGAHKSYTVTPKGGYAYSINLSGSTAQVEIIPGQAFTIDPSITNTSTGNVYMFVRINCPSIATENGYKPIYTFTPSEESAGSWSEVESLRRADENGAQIVIAYGSESMTTVEPDDTVQLIGSLTLDVTNKEYKDVKENLGVEIHGCAVHSDAEGEELETSADPYEAYQKYLELVEME